MLRARPDQQQPTFGTRINKWATAGNHGLLNYGQNGKQTCSRSRCCYSLKLFGCIQRQQGRPEDRGGAMTYSIKRTNHLQTEEAYTKTTEGGGAKTNKSKQPPIDAFDE